MKRQAFLLTIAFILLLTACGAQLKHIVTSVPDMASSLGSAEDRSIVRPRTGSTISFEGIFSWFAYELLTTVTDADEQDMTAHASNDAGDQGADRSGNSAGRLSTTDPYGLRDRVTFRAPSLPSALAPREGPPATKGR